MRKIVLITILVALFIGGCHEFTNMYDPYIDLVAYYPFDGDANNKAGYFINGFGGFCGNGMLKGGVEPTTDRFGNENGAYSFDGEDGAVSIPGSDDLCIQEALTLSAWVYLEEEDWDYARIVVKEEGESHPYVSYGLMADHDGSGKFGFHLSTEDDGIVYVQANSSHKICQWYLVTGVWDGTTMKLYIDGVLQAETATATGNIQYSSKALNMGGDTVRDIEYLKGKVDDVRIYNRSLSASEISAIYRGTDTVINPEMTEPELWFQKRAVSYSFSAAHSVHAVDVDDDGDMDVLGAATQGYGNGIAWFQNNGSGVFTQHAISGSMDDANSVYAVDVDGDGDMDVLGSSYIDHSIFWLENNGTESFTPHYISSNFQYARQVYGCDLDGDGDIDILGAALDSDHYSTDHPITWWENDGSENFTEHRINNDVFGYGATSLNVCDIDGDGDMDVIGVIDDSTWFSVYWYENDGDESFTEHYISGFSNAVMQIHAGDIDGDGDVDVLGATTNSDMAVAWWENDGNETFTEHAITDALAGAYAIHEFDPDGDGDVDVLGLSEDSGKDVFWLENDGEENFTFRVVSDCFGGANEIYTADLDGDGDDDILGASSLISGPEYTIIPMAWWENTRIP